MQNFSIRIEGFIFEIFEDGYFFRHPDGSGTAISKEALRECLEELFMKVM